MSEGWLRDRWLALWKSAGARGDPFAPFKNLVRRYREPHRKYHTLGHIAYCLTEFDRVRHLAAHPDRTEFALWYHDAVYDVRSRENEEWSATLAAGIARIAGLGDAFVDDVLRHIRTTTHTELTDDLDSRIVADADLASLGASPEVFAVNTRHIREEYAAVPEDAFRKGSAALLGSFLNRGSVFQTEFFRNRYEAQARENIANLLAWYATGSP